MPNKKIKKIVNINKYSIMVLYIISKILFRLFNPVKINKIN